VNAVLLFTVLVTEATLLLVAVWDWRELRRRGARRPAYALTCGAILLTALAPVAYFSISAFPRWLVAILVIPQILVSLLPGQLVRLTGGPHPLWQLAAISEEISARWDRIVSANEVTAADRVWFVNRSTSLERWRSAETSELVDLYQAKIADLLKPEEPDGFAALVSTRNSRIDELHEQIYRRLGVRRR
jgi:hypothetical protein